MLHFCKAKWKMDVVIESCLNGSSEMVGQLAMAVTVILFNLSMMKLAGDDGVAAITVMNYSQFLLNTIFIGFSMGVAPVIGHKQTKTSITFLPAIHFSRFRMRIYNIIFWRGNYSENVC